VSLFVINDEPTAPCVGDKNNSTVPGWVARGKFWHYWQKCVVYVSI